MIDQDTIKELNVVQHFLSEKKAEDVAVIDVAETSPFASYIVIATCSNPRSLGAYMDQLEDELYKNKIEVSVKEGEPDSGWVIVQGQDVLVHLMLPGNRRMINLEELLERIKNKHHKAELE